MELVVINMLKKNTLSVLSSIWQWNNSPEMQVSCWIQDLYTIWVSARSANYGYGIGPYSTIFQLPFLRNFEEVSVVLMEKQHQQ